MKAIFLIRRTVSYKYLAPLINEALCRGYSVECWHDYDYDETGTKLYNFPSIENVPTFKQEGKLITKIFHGRDELLDELKNDSGIDLIFSMHFFNCELPGAALDDFKFKWVTLMSGLDNFIELSKINAGKARLHNKEIFCVYSQKYLDMGIKYFQTFFGDKLNLFSEDYMKIKIVGTSEFDAFEGIELDKVRKKYGIPDGAEILIYLPFQYSSRTVFAWEKAFCGMDINTFVNKNKSYEHSRKRNFIESIVYKCWYLFNIISEPFSRGCYFRGLTERNVIRAVRKFCDRNDLYLVVKPRLKFPVSEAVKKAADLIVWDDEKQQYPPVLKELMGVSRICVGYFSTGVVTAVFANVYSINIELPDQYFLNEQDQFWYSPKYTSMFQYPGVLENWTIEDMVHRFADKTLDSFAFNAKMQAQYVEKYSGFSDCRSSKRILDAVESEIKVMNGKNNMVNRS